MDEALVKLIFGVRGEGKTFYAKSQLRNVPRYIVYDPLAQYGDCGVCLETFDEFKKFLLANYRKAAMRAVYQPVTPETDFETVCELVYDLGNITYVVEEIGFFIGSMSLGFNLANIIQRGRHRNINFVGINQRPFGIPRILTSQAKEIVSFRQREPRDIEYFREFIGDEADKILTLPKYHHLRWTYDGNAITIEKS